MKLYLITITKVDGGKFVNFQMVDSETEAYLYARAFNSKHTKYIAKWEELYCDENKFIAETKEEIEELRQDKSE